VARVGISVLLHSGIHFSELFLQFEHTKPLVLKLRECRERSLLGISRVKQLPDSEGFRCLQRYRPETAADIVPQRMLPPPAAQVHRLFLPVTRVVTLEREGTGKGGHVNLS